MDKLPWRYRWFLLKTQFKDLVIPSARLRKATFSDAARASQAEALEVARKIVNQERASLGAAWDNLGFCFKEEVIFSLEIQFLWGVFYELVANGPSFPTNGYDRLLGHLIYFLVSERNKTFEEARDLALSIQSLYNEADPLFDAVQEMGRVAYSRATDGRGSDQYFIYIVSELHNSGFKPDGYLLMPAEKRLN
jgi:hypothetical protein